MLNSFVKDISGQTILPITSAKNVFDENGIDLGAHLDLIYSELGKRDIKRVYLDLADITDQDSPSTFDILSAMADNTLAFLAVDNSSHLVEEIGSRLGGVLLLFKKTSVYYSSAIFFTYRYGEIYHGVSGVGGESFVWMRNAKTIHSFHSGTANKLTAVNTYEKISSWGGTAINPRLINNGDGTITIPNGIHHILINGYVVIECVSGGNKFLQIFKNNAETNLMIKQYATENVTLTISDILLEVNEGDVFDLRVYSNSLDTLRFKHLTIEVID